jgi:hypothetical protein
MPDPSDKHLEKSHSSVATASECLNLLSVSDNKEKPAPIIDFAVFIFCDFPAQTGINFLLSMAAQI